MVDIICTTENQLPINTNSNHNRTRKSSKTIRPPITIVNHFKAHTINNESYIREA